MAEFRSLAEFDDELVSAYLDDELSAEERARVEARLAADPAAAQLLDELRAVSGAVRGLPRERAPRDLRASVLAGLERAAAEDDAQRHVVRLPSVGEDRWAGVRRGLVWSAMAIAATLLLVAIQPREEDGRPVAKVDDEPQRAVRPAEDRPAFRALEGEPGEADVADEALEERRGGVDDSAPAGVGSTEEDDRYRDPPAGAVADAESESAEELGDALSAQSATPGAELSESVSQLGALPESGTPGAAGGEPDRVRSFAGSAGVNQPAEGFDVDESKNESPDRGGVQVVEVELGEAAGSDARAFEQMLARNRIALNAETLTPAAAEDAAAKKALRAGDSILVEATPEQLEQILAAYQGRAVAVGDGRLSEELARLVGKKPAGAAATAVASGDLKALADWASRAADEARVERARRPSSESAGQAWRLSGERGGADRREQGLMRVGSGTPLATGAGPASQGLGGAAPEAGSRPAATQATDLDRMRRAGGAEGAGESVRVLFVFRPAGNQGTAAAAAPAAPAEK
jgi:hypothetical protein